MEKITLKKLNGWFEHLDERNKLISLLINELNIDELNEMSKEELINEIALPNDVSLDIEWLNTNNIEKLYSYLELNEIKYNINHILDFIDEYDDEFFSSLRNSDIIFFISTYTDISTKNLNKWNISKEQLINVLKKGEN